RAPPPPHDRRPLLRARSAAAPLGRQACARRRIGADARGSVGAAASGCPADPPRSRSRSGVTSLRSLGILPSEARFQRSSSARPEVTYAAREKFLGEHTSWAKKIAEGQVGPEAGDLHSWQIFGGALTRQNNVRNLEAGCLYDEAWIEIDLYSFSKWTPEQVA